MIKYSLMKYTGQNKTVSAVPPVSFITKGVFMSFRYSTRPKTQRNLSEWVFKHMDFVSSTQVLSQYANVFHSKCRLL